MWVLLVGLGAFGVGWSIGNRGRTAHWDRALALGRRVGRAEAEGAPFEEIERLFEAEMKR